MYKAIYLYHVVGPQQTAMQFVRVKFIMLATLENVVTQVAFYEVRHIWCLAETNISQFRKTIMRARLCI